MLNLDTLTVGAIQNAERWAPTNWIFKLMLRLIDMIGEPQEAALVAQNTDPLLAAYFVNAFSGVHPDALSMVYAAYREGYQLESFSVPNFRLFTVCKLQ